MALQPKHYKALEMIEENMLSLSEIAKACNLSYSYLKRLSEGEATTGQMGQLFHSEMNKLGKRMDQRTKKRLKSAKDILFKKLEKWARELPPAKLKDAQVRRMLDAINSLAKSTPQLEFNQFNQIYSGMNQEDILNEFKKLKSLSRATLDGIGVPGSGSQESGEISRLISSGGTAQEEQEDPVLRTPRKARDLSQKPKHD